MWTHAVQTRVVQESTVIKKTITSVEDTKKLEPSHTAGGNVKCCSHFGKQSGSSSKN